MGVVAATVDAASVAAMPSLRRLHLAELDRGDVAPLAASSATHLYLVRCALLQGTDALPRMAHLASLYCEEVDVPGDVLARLRARRVEVLTP
jgi:hypothetical protein